MIAYLVGTIRKKLPKAVIVDTGAIGYLVHLPISLLEKTEEKAAAEFFIHTKVREDDISLFGFETMAGLEFFKTLLNVNGIGPKLAMEILSHDTAKVKNAMTKKLLVQSTAVPEKGQIYAVVNGVEGEKIRYDFGKFYYPSLQIGRAHV